MIHRQGELRFDLLREDLPIVNEVFKENVYNFQPLPGMKVLDIGAHKGIFSLYCAASGAMVEAYEPNPESFAVLIRNIVSNNFTERIHARKAGVWIVGERKTLWRPKANSGAASLYGGTGSPVDIDCVAFANVIGDQVWDAVKLDAEGIEFDLLTTAADEVLQNIKFLTVELHNNLATPRAHVALIDRLNKLFEIQGVREADGRFNYIYATNRTLY